MESLKTKVILRALEFVGGHVARLRECRAPYLIECGEGRVNGEREDSLQALAMWDRSIEDTHAECKRLGVFDPACDWMWRGLEGLEEQIRGGGVLRLSLPILLFFAWTDIEPRKVEPMRLLEPLWSAAEVRCMLFRTEPEFMGTEVEGLLWGKLEVTDFECYPMHVLGRAWQRQAPVGSPGEGKLMVGNGYAAMLQHMLMQEVGG